MHTIWKLTQGLHQRCENQSKCVKHPRAPIGITPDACWHKLWANKSTWGHNMKIYTQIKSNTSRNLPNLIQILSQSFTMVHGRWFKRCKSQQKHVRTQYENSHRAYTKRVITEIKCVKNPRAPIGTTPDACWHKLWPNNRACTPNVSKRVTKLTKLATIVDPEFMPACVRGCANRRPGIFYIFYLNFHAVSSDFGAKFCYFGDTFGVIFVKIFI